MKDAPLPFDSPPAESARPQVGKDVTGEFAAASGRSGPLTVSALVAGIREALLGAYPQPVAVVGEVTNFKRASSGHLYFSLTDANAAIEAVMFRADAAAVRFEVADGLEVVAEGRVDVYDKQGRLQLYVRRLSPRGEGALELAFRQLTERLKREGLFDAAAKKPIPTYPRAIGVVTSPTGAAIRDIARTLRRRWPAARVYLVGVRVQGDSAGDEIAQAIALMDAAAGRLGIDTIIISRGGGSLEDLWAFNAEAVARAIFAAATPIVCGVGHETDFTIADFVADLRAATPTAAAELAVPDAAALRRHCGILSRRLERRVAELLANGRTGLRRLAGSVIFRDPAGRVRWARQGLDELTARLAGGLAGCLGGRRQRLHQADRALIEHHPRRLLERSGERLARRRRDLAWALGRRAKLAWDGLSAVVAGVAAAHPRHRLALASQRVKALRRQLEAMSYKAPIKRGYSVARVAGRILRSAAEAAVGDVLETELIDGRIESQVRGRADNAADPIENVEE